MPTNLDTFWTDDVQASERLNESYIMKQNEIVRVVGVDNGSIVYRKAVDETPGRLPMADPSWNKFRSLPSLGWINVSLTGKTKRVIAVYLRRSALRTRTHGINNSNTLVYDFVSGGERELVKSRILNLATVFNKGSYHEEQPFPAFRDVFPLLRPKDSIALSAKLAIHKDARGITTLYRKRKAVGFFPDINNLTLFADSTFYREDLQEDHDLLPVIIKEI